ncbi:hypothetical protein [Marinomonas sp. A3A]|uniref:hypothetical protein n=1 Tax=Marinomonas sp. A3A TaxID=2065312 RepID=UPI001BB3C732|nr:hypothetical protein [Marinomonas sp. A3A]
MMSDENKFIPPHTLNTAVLFLVFNRLDTTKQVFEAIRQAKPPRLYIAADGARTSKEGEAEKVQLVRDYITQNIDWDCEVKTLFREKNLGCKYAVSGAITWFFENEEQGIILEDDCLPSQSFFWFCECLLETYKNDLRVWHIGGVSTIPNSIISNDDSYYFSALNHIWGWASWKNRWEKYDVDIVNFPEYKENENIKDVFNRKLWQKFWLSNFEGVYSKKIDTWDYQWCFATWANRGISIVPTVNLIANIGFGADATHTTESDAKMSNRAKKEMQIPITHPSTIRINKKYDEYNFKYLFEISYFSLFLNGFKKQLKKILRFN